MTPPRFLTALLSVLTVSFTAWSHFPPDDGATGKVADALGPVTGAKVRYQGSSSFQVSNAMGQFQLPASAKKPSRVTAWKKGYLIGVADLTGPMVQLTLKPLPGKDNEDYSWIDPTPHPKQANNCGNCHAQIYQEWHGSAHARSAKNPRFLSLFGGTDWHGKPSPTWSVVDEHPLGSAVCASCHAPTFTDPNLDYDMRKVPGVAAQGVHCDYCHKVVDAPTDKLGLRFGRDGLPLMRPKGDTLLNFGPLEDAYRAGEDFGYLPLYKESRYCASCHEGIVFGVHVYGTYSEWLKSPAKVKGQQCQDCHMKSTGKLTNIAPGKGGIERDPLTLASHHFPGTAADMLRQCLQADVKVQPGKDDVSVTVKISARQVGHRVPTGFIDRNLALVVEASDVTGKPVPLLKGPKLPAAAGKKLAGKPGFLYAKQLPNAKGQIPSPFWLPHDKLVDTRLQPEQADQQLFQFGPTTKQMRVRLIYRRFWHEVMVGKSWPDDAITVLDKTWP
jgi:hypothetical protein